MRAGDDVHGHELADSPRGRGSGVCRRFHRADVAADHHGHVTGADVFLAHKDDVGSFHHRVGCLDRPNETSGLDHSQGFEWHANGTLTDCGSWRYWLSVDQPWPTLTPAHKDHGMRSLLANGYRVDELMAIQSGRILVGALDRIVCSSANYWAAMLSDLAAALAFSAHPPWPSTVTRATTQSPERSSARRS